MNGYRRYRSINFFGADLRRDVHAIYEYGGHSSVSMLGGRRGYVDDDCLCQLPNSVAVINIYVSLQGSHCHGSIHDARIKEEVVQLLA